MPAQLPTFADLGFASPQPSQQLPQFPQEDAEAQGTAAVGKGLQSVGEGATAIGFEREFARQKLNESNATTDLFNRLVPLQTAAAQETDPAKLDDIRGQINGLLDTSGQAIDDPTFRARWQAQHNETILR